MSAPLLELTNVRICQEGKTLAESLSLRSSGERIGLLGATGPLASALFGDATVRSGEFLISGVELERARASKLFDCARAWPTPSGPRSTMTVLDGLRLSAMLGGCGRREAARRADAALAGLGLLHLGKQRLSGRRAVEQELAGLLTAALFEPEIVVVDWPLGQLSPEQWARYGTALGRLLERRRWIARVNGAARLPAEAAWVQALDQLLFVDRDLSLELAAGKSQIVRTLLVLAADASEVQEPLSALGLGFTTAKFHASVGSRRSAYVLELPRDELGRPSTDRVLAFCDEHQLPIVRLEPLEIQC